jgi:thiosulfate dehydrogenase (quinone) large subunit
VGKKKAQAVKQQPSKQVSPVRSPAGDRWLAYGTLPLRLFLGATFVYAAIQKISDPGFLQPGSATYIGSQLQAFAAQSPIGFLIEIFALPTPQLTGIGVIAAELAIGALVIAGIATRWAAAGGAMVNLVFFLTASWSVQPYFLGSDSIYTVAWITLVIVGDQGIFTVRPLLFGETAARRPVDLERRRLLLQLGGAAVAAIWVMGLLPRIRHSGGGQASSSPTAEASPTAVASPTGTKVGSVSDLQSQGFLNFQDPKSGDPAVAVSLSGGSVVAFDAVCTHAGCPVSYDTGQKLLACPCHGALFDPAHGAAVVAGPAPTPLASIPVRLGTDGGVYAD